MTHTPIPDNMFPQYKKGVEDGFKIADEYFKSALKQFYKETKRGLIRAMATTTVTNGWKIEALEKQKKEIEEELKELNKKI